MLNNSKNYMRLKQERILALDAKLIDKKVTIIVAWVQCFN